MPKDFQRQMVLVLKEYGFVGAVQIIYKNLFLFSTITKNKIITVLNLAQSYLGNRVSNG